MVASLLGTAARALAARSRLGNSPSPPAGSATRHLLGGRCGSADDCGFNTVCRRQVCSCPPGWNQCGADRCHYLRQDHNHCGTCGHACGLKQECFNGVCI